MERLRKHTTIFYSTHILDDVQRVSDTVAILDKGQLVAQAPIDELLSARGGSVFHMKIRGDTRQAKSLVTGQPWVTGIQEERVDGASTWLVSVKDAAAAEQQLVSLVLSDPTLRVMDFGQSKVELEEVFLSMVGEVKHGQ